MAKDNIKSVSIIGAGNVAWHLAKALDRKRYQINGIWSRDPKNAKQLASKVSSTPYHLIGDLPKSHLYIISTVDDAIAEVANQVSDLLSQSAIICHTSGSVASTVLNKESEWFGVIYPLMSFKKGGRNPFPNVPLLVDGNHKYVKNQLKNLSESISNKVYFVSDTERKYLHIAAVFASNFANHMFSLSKEICEDHGLDFNMLLPLLKANSLKLEAGQNPKYLQTGPAMRRDQNVIGQHLNELKLHPSKKAIYEEISKSIQKMHL